MSSSDADRFLERIETDESFQEDLKTTEGDPQAALDKAKAAGFDFTPEEVQEALVERYGVELTPEQLDAIAAGDTGTDIAAGIGGTVLIGVAVSVMVYAAAV